jgi:hypothetical protein
MGRGVVAWGCMWCNTNRVSIDVMGRLQEQHTIDGVRDLQNSA